MKEIWELKVKGEFSSAHALRHYEGKCERTHGHNFKVEIGVEGDKLDPDTHILIDFKILKLNLDLVLAELDHVFLNEIPPFDQLNPSSENLAKYIWERLEALLEAEAAHVHLMFVEIAENSRQCAVYRKIKPLP